MGRELPSSHKPWLFDEYQYRLTMMAETVSGKRDEEVEGLLARLTPYELEMVYYVAYDCLPIAAASRLLGMSPTNGDRYWQSALRKLRGLLEPMPEWRPDGVESALMEVFG